MPRPVVRNRLIDFDDMGTKRRFLSWAGTLRGVNNVTIEPKRSTRSLRQNAAFWALIIEPFYQFLHEQEYAGVDRDYAKRMLCAKILGTEDEIDPTTGEVFETVAKGTSKLSTEEFSDFFEKCQAYLADEFGIVTQDPDPNYREKREAVAHA